jgi:hypothetical protein
MYFGEGRIFGRTFCLHVQRLGKPSKKQGPPLWSSGQSCWLQLQRFGFDSQRYQIFSEVVGLEMGPLDLVSTTEELLGRKSGDSGLESREYGSRDPSSWPRCTLYPQKLTLTSPTSGGRSVCIVCSWTQATKLFKQETGDILGVTSRKACSSQEYPETR